MAEGRVSTNCSQVPKFQSVMWTQVLEVRPPASSHIDFNRSATLGAQAGNSTQKIATLNKVEIPELEPREMRFGSYDGVSITSE